MKTILVDDELWSMQAFKDECEGNPLFDVVGVFCDSSEALEFVKNNRIDFALLDIEMPGMSGLELGEEIKKIYSSAVIIYVTAFSEYAIDAVKQHADSYILKPYTSEDVIDVMKRASLLSKRTDKRVYVRTFGRFEVFVDGLPLQFGSAKAKELFALCVYHCGGNVYADEIIEKLWEDYEGTVSECANYRMTVKRLIGVLAKYGLSEIFIRDTRSCSVRKDLIDSDFYRFLDGDENAICELQDEFMSDYSWAEAGYYPLSEKKEMYRRKRKKA